MQIPRPDDEAARVEALRSLKILDTPPERAFDDLTRLTSYICGTPLAVLGFMDSDRLWFKSRVGWDATEVPRDMSFCAHTILHSDALIISDTLADDGRLAECPLASHGGIRFYAGIPLFSADGYALGTLCAMDSVPRGLTHGQTEAMRSLARQVTCLLESRAVLAAARTDASHLQPSIGPHPTSAVQGFSFWRDISEQQRAREALRQSQRRLEGIIASAMDAIITIDSSHRIVVFNKAAEQMFRCAAAEALRQPLDNFIPERFRATHRQQITDFADTGVTSRSMYSPGMRFAVRADGEEFPIEATISQADFEGEKLFNVILRDIGPRLRMESELRQAQKMEAVGQLAGGIAHEFNNFLSIILGYSELLAEEGRGAEKLAHYVSEIRGATQHAASLTHQLLAFSRKKVLAPQLLDLNQAIWDSHSFLRRLMPANIDVVPVLSPVAGRVTMDPGELQQILINLLVNARDAMPQGGKVTIETAAVQFSEATSEAGGPPPGAYVLLSVADTGTGMSDDTRSRVFEPFFTTKEPGKGTGLGLSTVYGIVKHSGGSICVDSLQGQGTTIRIYLPQVTEAITLESTSPECLPQKPEDMAKLTVLVVEDEAALRHLICTALEKRNYKVVPAKDGQDAMAIFREYHDGEIRLVITDLMMPRMDGFELKQQISTLAPGTKFLFMSGYAEQILEQHQGSLEDCSFREKPFLPDELLKRVRSALGADLAA